MVHDVTTLPQISIKLILNLAGIWIFCLFSHDMSQAYIPSQQSLTRDANLRPMPENEILFDINKNKVFKSRKQLYGFCDPVDYWNLKIDTIEKNLKKICN